KSSLLRQKQKALQILLRPGIKLKELKENIPSIFETIGKYDNEILEEAEIQIKYDTYIKKEKELVGRMSHIENLEIPENFDYQKLQSLSTEARQKLNKIRPGTIGQASRISGVSPSDVQVLMIYMGR